MGTVIIRDGFRTCDLCRGPRQDDEMHYSLSAVRYPTGFDNDGFEWRFSEVCETCWGAIYIAIHNRTNASVVQARSRFAEMVNNLIDTATYDKAVSDG